MDIFKNGDGRVVMVMGESAVEVIRDALAVYCPLKPETQRERALLSSEVQEFFMRQRAEVKL